MEKFDVIVIGTGLVECILAGYEELMRSLQKSGKKVLHLESECRYGGEQQVLHPTEFLTEIDFNLDIVVGSDADVSVEEHCSETKAFMERMGSDDPAKANFLDKIVKKSRDFYIEMQPMVLFSRGDMVRVIANSGVGPSLEFQLVKTLYCFTDSLSKVPGSKEDVFANDSISLIDKRRIMKFFTFALEYNPEYDLLDELKGKSFVEYLEGLKIPKTLIETIASTIVFEVDVDHFQKMTVLEGIQRTHQHLSSIGQYGPHALLTALYGTGSELCQAFSRYCAVFGGCYILDYDIKSIKKESDGWVISNEYQATNLILSSRFAKWIDSNAIEKPQLHRLVCISDKPFVGDGEHAIITTLPTTENGMYIMQLNSENQVCPEGYYILHCWSDAKKSSIESLQKAVRSLCKDLGETFMDLKKSDSQRYFEDEDETMELEMESKFEQFSKVKFIHKDVIESLKD